MYQNIDKSSYSPLNSKKSEIIKITQELYSAYKTARKNKRNTKAQLKFEINLEKNIHNLAIQIINFNYKILPNRVFIIKKPVIREIFAAQFQDRVVHHFIFNRINAALDTKFIHDSYSCRKNRGTLMGVKSLKRHINRQTLNGKNPAWVLKLDILSYFMTIPRDKLLETTLKLAHINDNITKHLLFTTILNDPAKNCIEHCDSKLKKKLPKTKSLFNTPTNCGLPIGNLTSQLLSNVYLNKLDHFIKRQLKCKHYGRYVDDFYIVHHSKPTLKRNIPIIQNFLRDKLQLSLHPNKIHLQSTNKAVKFLGYIIRGNRIYPTAQNIHRATTNLRALINLYNTASTEHRSFLATEILQRYNSFFAYLKHTNSFHSHPFPSTFSLILRPSPLHFHPLTPHFPNFPPKTLA